MAKIWLVLISLLLLSCSKEIPVSTANSNVTVIEKQFTIPQLQRTRGIRVYLPPGYSQSEQHYPVLYMHDGQNVFDNATSYAGEWKVDETLDQLSAEMGINLIVVAVDNGGEKRMNELSPWGNKEFGEAEGEQYMRLIVDVIKPYIDSTYRSLPDQANTAIMGSSMGGLISHFAMYRYPHVFSKAGIFSPSYWFSQAVYTYSQNHALNPSAKLFFVVGSKEGETMVKDMQNMVKQIVDQGHKQELIKARVVQGAKHNESFWAAEFSAAIQWLYKK